MQGTYTPKQPRKIPDGLIWSLLIFTTILIVLATIGFTLYFVNYSRGSQLEPTPALVVEPPVQETPTIQTEEEATETAVPEQLTVVPTEMAAETPVVIETAVSSRPSPTFTAEATLPPPVTPTQQPLFVPTAPPLPVAWRGEYYNNRDLSGIAALIRDDASLNFDWGLGAPASGIPADNFSVRWERTLFFSAGTYRFHVRGDDGARVWIDNQIIIDQWHDAANNSYSAERLLSAGNHTIIIAYYENTGQAGFSFWWEAVGQFPQWQAEYFANTTLSGIPVLTRNDMEINFDWGGSNPVPGTAADNFSVRWRRSLSFEEGNYRFHALIDDGARIYVDGNLVLDNWQDGGLREVTADRLLSAGTHQVQVEYYERSGEARMRVWWEKINQVSYPDWKGEYWDNRSLQGSPAFTRNDNNINFDWKFNSPHSSLPSDNFSVRWSRRLNLEAGIYRFFAKADDGVRVYVDGQPVINEWHDSGGNTTYKADVTLTAGNYAVVVEYYEREFGAEVKVWRERLGALPTATPTATTPLPTAVPPTATATMPPPTAVPPTATATTPPPTAVPPTATPTVIPTATPTGLPPTATPTDVPPVTPMPSTAIALNPDSGSANDLVMIIGDGYPSQTAVFVHIGRPNEAPFPQPIASTQTDQGGKVHVSFLMPAAWPDGSMINRDVILVYLATADFEESASAKFNYVQAGQPGLSLSPTQGALGSVVTITGSGFPATSRVEIYLSTPDNRGDETSYAQANTSQKGNFVIQFTLPTKWANGEPITGNSLRIAASGENNIQAAEDFLLLNGTVE